MKPLVFAVLAVAILGGCKGDIAAVVPINMTDEALGHDCQVFVSDHPGPKAQVHLRGTPPLCGSARFRMRSPTCRIPSARPRSPVSSFRTWLLPKAGRSPASATGPRSIRQAS